MLLLANTVGDTPKSCLSFLLSRFTSSMNPISSYSDDKP